MNSGAGKGTVVKELVKRSDKIKLSVSATTRSPRVGEAHGREYFFITRGDFEQRIKDGAVLEYAQYCGNYYGTPRKYVEEQCALGNDVILEIEVQGGRQVKKLWPLAVYAASHRTMDCTVRGAGSLSVRSLLGR